ncbi:hypothetical protein GOARA_021_00860 [Gordonia araii NBRC 100433]|uniref:Uncharacterized protein n=1 Tax=Gordonia araii NBRC 100433 TaxID=1073574 RepID=G7GZ24_9ACTN|nr:hypothetical protein GOARA_021_00860 [Gordonia araii NBRC 100433]
MRSWCLSKRWDANAIADPGIAAVANGVHASFVEEERQDDSTIARWRFTQTGSDGTWTTQVTTVLHRDRSGVVWIDLYAPGDKRPAPPRVIRNISEVVDALDGGYHSPAAPVRAYPDDVDTILGTLTDERRRGLVFLAGSDDRLGPISQWVAHVTKLLNGTNGLATAYILDAETTEELNSRMSPAHAVKPWTIRTFYPNPDFSSADDALRHRILSTNRIASSDDRGVAQILRNAALRNSTELPLPRELVRVDRRLRAMLDDALVQRASATAVALEATPPLSAGQAGTSNKVPADSSRARSASKRERFTPALVNALRDGLEKVVGQAELSIEAVSQLVAVALDGIRNRQNLDLLRQRLRALEAERGVLEDEHTELQRQLEDAQLDQAVDQERLDDANRELRHLRSELAKLDQGSVEWATERTALEFPPESFRDLLARIDDLDHIEFTGDPKQTVELDDHDHLGTWAKKTWNIIRALNDYAHLRSTGAFAGSVDDYAANTPMGCVGITGHKAGETPQTQNHPKYRRIRTLPVPTSVNPEGKVFMGAHVAIAKLGMISPRLHYYSDASRSGKIYVGYIGKHLDNFRTT